MCWVVSACVSTTMARAWISAASAGGGADGVAAVSPAGAGAGRQGSPHASVPAATAHDASSPVIISGAFLDRSPRDHQYGDAEGGRQPGGAGHVHVEDG